MLLITIGRMQIKLFVPMPVA